MNREFLDLYNRELKVLEDSAREFGQEFPGVADRLGGLAKESMDPMIHGMLEGAAFLAARVQLKIKHEFEEFTNNLLEQLLPHYLAPVPSAAMMTVAPPFDDPALKDGRRIPRGSYLDAQYLDRERRVSCRFRLGSDIMLWPLEITNAAFLSQRSQVAGLGIETGHDIVSGLRIRIRRRSAGKSEDEPSDAAVKKQPDLWLSSLKLDDLPVHIVAAADDAIRLYEKLFANCRSIHLRYADEFGNPVLIDVPQSSLAQVGLDPEDTLVPCDHRLFHGFELLRELFLLPEKFLGFRLSGLRGVLHQIKAREADIIFTFDQPDTRLASVVKDSIFALFVAPAVNLFEMQANRIPIVTNEFEYQVVPDRGRYLEYEPHRLVKVFAHFIGSSEKQELRPLYSVPVDNIPQSDVIYYNLRRLMRKRTVEERRYGKSSNYIGTDMFITIAPNPTALRDRVIAELSVRAICSNRHLTEHLPVGQGGADFVLEMDSKLPMFCIAGPTMPRESIISKVQGGQNLSGTRSSAWRLISMLSLNHLGITGRGTENSAAAIRELFALFAETNDTATERRIRGITAVDSVPAVRRVRQPGGSATVRGLEVIITFEEKAFEGSGLFLFGAVLDRFFAEYAPVNSFVQTVVRSTERGQVMRWKPRVGARVTL